MEGEEKHFILQLNNKNTSNSIFKNGQNLENDILPKRIYKWIVIYTKMLNIINYYRSAN